MKENQISSQPIWGVLRRTYFFLRKSDNFSAPQLCMTICHHDLNHVHQPASNPLYLNTYPILGQWYHYNSIKIIWFNSRSVQEIKSLIAFFHDTNSFWQTKGKVYIEGLILNLQMSFTWGVRGVSAVCDPFF